MRGGRCYHFGLVAIIDNSLYWLSEYWLQLLHFVFAIQQNAVAIKIMRKLHAL